MKILHKSLATRMNWGYDFRGGIPHRHCEIIIMPEAIFRVPRQQKPLPFPPPVAKFTTDMHKRLTQLSHGAG